MLIIECNVVGNGGYEVVVHYSVSQCTAYYGMCNVHLHLQKGLCRRMSKVECDVEFSGIVFGFLPS